ncbi:MAG: class II fructose-bisphosphate aldolase [Gammaproteobacteria bacterium]|nr:class II fructose-bisphosphate aldolase [Gammaproteobacteria bacterium]
MPLINMRDMIYHAYENSYAVGAFDLVSLDFLEAVIDSAERCRAPVILSIAEPHFAHFDFELMMPAVEAAAKRASIPVAIQLDHASDLNTAIKAIGLGCNGVMFDASNLSLHENISATKEIVDMAHNCGIPVIGEQGYVAGIEGEGAKQHPGESILTSPAEACAYVERTGIDFLAVSIGTVQGRMKSKAKLDFTRLKQLNQAVNIPLVIHGGSGLNEDQFRRLITHGVAKINYFTGLSDIAAQTMREKVKTVAAGSFTDLKQGVKEAIGKEVERCLKVWGSAGRAAEVLAQCEPWTPIEHLITYNVEQLDEWDANIMMNEGRRILSEIPGVREVFAGEAIKEGAKYRFCWMVRFTHKSAVESYHAHPNHAIFSDKLLRPYARDKLSIDFKDGATTNAFFVGGSASVRLTRCSS